MTNDEVNRAVSKKLGLELFEDGTVWERGQRVVKDYCNDPRDAWPIIIENKIDIHHYASNPLRAAMLCFLAME